MILSIVKIRIKELTKLFGIVRVLFGFKKNFFCFNLLYVYNKDNLVTNYDHRDIKIDEIKKFFYSDIFNNKTKDELFYEFINK